MRVFRLQNDEGLGPYSIPRPSTNGWGGPSSTPVPEYAASYLRIERDWTVGNWPSGVPDPHPAPFEDGLILPWGTIRQMHFGFGTAQSLIDWFIREPQDPHALDAMGLGVWEFNVPAADVIRGGHQVAFRRPKSADSLIRSTSVPRWARRYAHLLPDEVLR